MAGKLHSFLPYFPDTGEGVNLEAAAVGKDGFIPTVKFVEAPGFLERIGAGPEVKVISIGQHYLGMNQVRQLVHVHGLNSPEGAHRHKNRGLDFSVSDNYFPASCL